MNLSQSFSGVMLITVIALMSITACAASDGGDGKGKRKPPKVAIEACEGKQVGDSVSFTGRRGETLQATCKEIQGLIVAVPEGGPR